MSFLGRFLIIVLILCNAPALTTATQNKSIPLTLNYIFADFNSRLNSSSSRGQFPLPDIIVDIVNRNHTVLPQYRVAINALQSRYALNVNIGITIEMFLSNVIGTGTQFQEQPKLGRSLLSDICANRDVNTSHVSTEQFVLPSAVRTGPMPTPLYFGPEISAEVRVIAQLAARFNLVGKFLLFALYEVSSYMRAIPVHTALLQPQISSIAAANDLSDRLRYPNFFRTELSSQPFMTAPRALLSYLNYTTVGLMHIDQFLGIELMQAVETDLRTHNFHVLYRQIYNQLQNEASDREFIHNAQIYDARVFVLQSNTKKEYQTFCHAINTIGHDIFTAKNYIFIFLMLIDSDVIIVPRSIEIPDCTYAMLDRLLNTSFAVMSPTWDNSPGKTDLGVTVAELKQQILNVSRSEKYNDSSLQLGDIFSLCANMADMFWTGLLALDALDKRLRAETPVPRTLLDFTFKSADMHAMLKEEITKTRFRGASGPISFRSDGNFLFNITINQYIAGEGYRKRFTFDPETTQLTIISPPTFATNNGLPPPDKKPPPPPVDEAAARNQLIITLLVTIIAVIVVGLGGALAVYAYYRRSLAKRLANPSWVYDQSQLKMRFDFQSLSSLAASSLESEASSTSGAEYLPTFPTALLNGGDSIVKLQLISPAGSRLQINEKNYKIMTAFRDSLQHVNVVHFVGYSMFGQRVKKRRAANMDKTAEPEQFLIWEHCEKGSLEDLMSNQAFKLDATFECALLLDVAEGMAFLHRNKSAQVIGQAHGKLNPDTCLIDRRFSVKIAAYGDQVLSALFDLESLEIVDETEENKKQVYRAPELLGQNSDISQGTQASDVYAYAMTIFALITRLSPVEGVSNLGGVAISTIAAELGHDAGSSKTPTRPTIPAKICQQSDKRLLDLMQRCWAEQPSKRPLFSEVAQQLRKITHVKGRSHNNITDQLLNRLERYASDMESLVAERTLELSIEKRRSDDLLNRMLPPEVVAELKKHGHVQPESFDSVTIYFSDIVGFTTLSSTSTPIEVVNLLNALYTMFDAKIDRFDAYKVETIGDAYMVVSGLPRRNGRQHAAEVASLSLALLNGIKTFVIPHRPLEKLMLRIGLHTGPCVAGVVGVKMPRYCLFGDTVNTASRMESNGLPLKIHMSDVTKKILSELGGFCTEVRGQLDIKGKGIMETHWLTEDQ